MYRAGDSEQHVVQAYRTTQWSFGFPYKFSCNLKESGRSIRLFFVNIMFRYQAIAFVSRREGSGIQSRISNSIRPHVSLCSFTARRCPNLADLIFDNGRLTLLNDESPRTYVQLILQGLQSRTLRFEPDLYN